MAPRKTTKGTPIQVWRGMVEQDLARAVLAPSRPIVGQDDAWQHPLPMDKLMRLQEVRRESLRELSQVAHQHVWW